MQFDWGTIDPYVVDGSTLASYLNQWRDAIHSMHRGAARPSYAVPGMMWVNDSSGPTNWRVMVFLGPSVGDKALVQYDTTTGAVTSLIDQISAAAIVQSGTFQWFTAANPADTKYFRSYVHGDGTLRIESLTDAGALQSYIKLDRSGTITTPSDVNAYGLRVGRFSVGFGAGVINTDGNYGLWLQANGVSVFHVEPDGVGYIAGPPAGANDSSVPNTAWVRALIASAGLAKTGDTITTYRSVADPGWIVANDGTIGNAASGATTRANPDTWPLYSLLYPFGDTNCPVSGGRTGNAANDYNANKAMRLPLTMGRVFGNAGGGGGLTARNIGDAIGAETWSGTSGNDNNPQGLGPPPGGWVMAGYTHQHALTTGTMQPSTFLKLHIKL